MDVRCHTPGAGCTSSSDGTTTLPTEHTRPRSLRTRSVIITFSATSFTDLRSSAAFPSSNAPRRGNVPLIGVERTRRPCRARNSSGDSDTTDPHTPETNAEREGAGRRTPSANSAAGDPENEPVNRVHTFAWNRSPASIDATHAFTACSCSSAGGRRNEEAVHVKGAADPSARSTVDSGGSGSSASDSNQHTPAASHRST